MLVSNFSFLVPKILDYTTEFTSYYLYNFDLYNFDFLITKSIVINTVNSYSKYFSTFTAQIWNTTRLCSKEQIARYQNEGPEGN